MENDLISRKALIAEYDRVHVGPPSGARKLMEDAPEVPPKVVAEIKIDGDTLRRLVDEVIEEIKAIQDWIPCSERLPEVHEAGNSFSGIYMQSYPVLVYGVSEYEEKCGFYVVTYCDDLNGCTYWATADAETINGVKAWMPLPKPYKEDNNAENS